MADHVKDEAFAPAGKKRDKESNGPRDKEKDDIGMDKEMDKEIDKETKKQEDKER